MAQVYSFVDENGATRLFAEIHPDPAGTPFNGGTITEGLTIADPDGAEDQLTITGTGSGGAKLINAAAVHTTFTVDSDGTVVMSSDDGMGVQVTGTGGTGASVGVSSDASGTPACNLSTTQGFTYTKSGATNFTANSTILKFLLNAAPSDGALSAGQCSFWLDATNGAAKLMVKAKQADGTVVSAAIALA